MENLVNFTRIKNDVNGNPRYVFHFLELSNDYERALKIAKKLFHGRKFSNKQYGGGVVVQTYSLPNIEKLIKENKEN